MREADLERLYEEHAAALFGFLVYRTGDRALAEDVVADTFERALRARRRFDLRRGSEKTWLYSIALNRLRDLARREDAHRRALEQVKATAPRDDARGALMGVEDRQTLAVALEQLTPEEREAVALRYGADLSLKEIARVTGVKMTTAEGRVYRGLEKLRGLI
jgi:RNA polymerase sigma factor (sigma-70 family)